MTDKQFNRIRSDILAVGSWVVLLHAGDSIVLTVLGFCLLAYSIYLSWK